MDSVLLSAGVKNIEACAALAHEHGLGIEVMAFAFPEVLDGDWKYIANEYQTLLANVPGPITLHGPFMDMAPGSPDAQINAICVERYKHAIVIAAEFNAEKIVFHANYIAAIHNLSYRQGWHQRNVHFWGEMAEFAQKQGVTVTIENMWEFDPKIITDILEAVNHPYLRGCLDVGHAHLFGGDYPFDTWLAHFEPYLIHMHVNNTHGKLDTHNALNDGVIDYQAILRQMRELAFQPTVVLEMYEVEDMHASLPYFQLETTHSES